MTGMTITATASGITIAPRYADRKATIPMPTWRNVHTEDGYVGCVLVHDGRWTPLYATERDAATDAALERAAALLNAGN